MLSVCNHNRQTLSFIPLPWVRLPCPFSALIIITCSINRSVNKATQNVHSDQRHQWLQAQYDHKLLGHQLTQIYCNKVDLQKHFSSRVLQPRPSTFNKRECGVMCKLATCRFTRICRIRQEKSPSFVTTVHRYDSPFSCCLDRHIQLLTLNHFIRRLAC